jgi:DNA-binding IclR family transcriptional regulator
MNLTTWQYALYAQLEDRPHTVRQLMSANALSQDEAEQLLRDLQSLGLAERDGALWRLEKQT